MYIVIVIVTGEERQKKMGLWSLVRTVTGPNS